MAARPPPQGWPPLITAAGQPPWMLWRDRALTMLMWIVFAIILETEAELTIAHVIAIIKGVEPEIPANWDQFMNSLFPFTLVIIALVSWLVFFGLLTMRRRLRTMLLPQPPPLAFALEAQRAGMEAPSLAEARRLDLAVAHLDAAGHYRIEPRPQG